MSQGRDHLQVAEGKCPFCQQTAPEALAQLLAAYFADGYDEALTAARAIETRVSERSATLEAELDTLERAAASDPEVDGAVLQKEIDVVRTAASLVQQATWTKSEHSTQAVHVTDTSAAAMTLVDLIENENAAIAEHNALITNAKAARDRLVEDGWSLFLSEPTVASAIKRFHGVTARKDARITELREKIDESEETEDRDSQEIGRLRASISNPTHVADRINSLLKAMGLLNFKLDVAAGDSVVGGYRIVREDGTPAYSSLSEGERSFIAFAYFWESLIGSSAAGGRPEDVVAVIDDPISSLDSDSLYAVAARIRDMASESADGRSNVRQLVVMTHNTQFHREAAFTVNDPRAAERHYFRLRKTPRGVTLVDDDKNKNKVQGTYQLFWGAVVEAARNSEDCGVMPVGLENVVRRIVEWYFRTVGSVRSDVRPRGLLPGEDHLISTFHMWANAGSHTIADDVDHTAHIGGTGQFLRLFRGYFDLMNHASHFEMMVKSAGGETLLENGALFARTAGAAEASTLGDSA